MVPTCEEVLLSGMSPSKGCGDFEEVKDVLGDLWRSFRLGAADSTCKCFWSQCQDIKGTESDEDLRYYEVERSQGMCYLDQESFVSSKKRPPFRFDIDAFSFQRVRGR